MERYLDFVADQWILFAALVIILVLLIRSWVAPKLSGVKEVNVNDAVRLLNQDDTLILDVRLDREFKTGFIQNSVNIPVGALDARVGEISKYKDNNILLVCQTGGRSSSAGQVLKKHGFEHLNNLNGGINAWINANMPVTTKAGKKKKS